MELLHTGLQILAHPLIMLFYGLLIHFARKRIASASHETDSTVCLADYWRKSPLQSLVSIIGAFVGFVVFIGIDLPTDGKSLDLARMSAFGIGYMADNIADGIGERTMRSLGIGKHPEDKPP